MAKDKNKMGENPEDFDSEIQKMIELKSEQNNAFKKLLNALEKQKSESLKKTFKK